jgi:hypothetical protein
MHAGYCCGLLAGIAVVVFSRQFCESPPRQPDTILAAKGVDCGGTCAGIVHAYVILYCTAAVHVVYWATAPVSSCVALCCSLHALSSHVWLYEGFAGTAPGIAKAAVPGLVLCCYCEDFGAGRGT